MVPQLTLVPVPVRVLELIPELMLEMAMSPLLLVCRLLQPQLLPLPVAVLDVPESQLPLPPHPQPRRLPQQTRAPETTMPTPETMPEPEL